jgi:hypothetical protein
MEPARVSIKRAIQNYSPIYLLPIPIKISEIQTFKFYRNSDELTIKITAFRLNFSDYLPTSWLGLPNPKGGLFRG